MVMTQKDWENLGAMVGLFIIALTVLWALSRDDDDYFDGGW